MPSIDPEPLDATATYKLLVGSVVPRPIAWTSTVSTDGEPNLAPFSFFTVVCRKPPMFSLTIQPRTDGLTSKDTLANIRETEEFVINVVSRPLAGAMHHTSFDHPPDADEFELAGLTPIAADLVRPPRVAEAEISMECVLEHVMPLGINDTVVIGRMVRYHVSDRVYDADSGRVDLAALAPVGRVAASYAPVETIFSLAGHSAAPPPAAAHPR
jgi:flavin reductase (DIM6/NTAB) family NADH-FMN oxidoreductase RutF